MLWALTTFIVLLDGILICPVKVAKTTEEGKCLRQVLSTLAFVLYLLLWFLSDVVLIELFPVERSSIIWIYPYAAHFRNRPELGSFEFIKEVIKMIRVLNKLRFLRIDSKLYFHQNFLSISQIYQNVFCTFLQSVLYPHDFEEFRTLFTYFVYLVIEGCNFILSGRAFTSNQVTDLKREERRNSILEIPDHSNFYIPDNLK